jgi:hypothetical protein
MKTRYIALAMSACILLPIGFAISSADVAVKLDPAKKAEAYCKIYAVDHLEPCHVVGHSIQLTETDDSFNNAYTDITADLLRDTICQKSGFPQNLPKGWSGEFLDKKGKVIFHCEGEQ